MGKYEELIVCSHEIAASTAQLVAASKVRGCVVFVSGLDLGPSLAACGQQMVTTVLPAGKSRQTQPPPEPPAGVLPLCQREGR